MRNTTKFTFVYLVLGTLTAGLSLQASAEDYMVHKGDSLSSIARQYYGEPVFGTKGTIQKIYKLNPTLSKNAVLEPGQKIILEGKGASEVVETHAAPVRHTEVHGQNQFEDNRQPAAVGVDAPPLEDEKPEPLSPAIEQALRVARGAASSPRPASEESPTEKTEAKPVEKEVAPAATETHAATEEQEAKHEAHDEHAAPHHEVDEAPDNFISIIPGYSMIKQTVNDPNSGTSYSLNSNPALSLKVEWDHSWSRSFSTLLTYTGMQLTSQETSDASGALVIHDMYLSKFELALFNHLTHWVRFGLGAAYGDHIFIENFTSVPADPQIYKTAFFNPFVAAEFTPYESHRFDWLINVKIGSLPAQNGLGHDLAAGTEFEGEVSLVEKFNRWAMVYSLGYSTEDQTRTDTTETRNEWALRVGAMF